MATAPSGQTSERVVALIVALVVILIADVSSSHKVWSSSTFSYSLLLSSLLSSLLPYCLSSPSSSHGLRRLSSALAHRLLSSASPSSSPYVRRAGPLLVICGVLGVLLPDEVSQHLARAVAGAQRDKWIARAR